jgi:hypothetical protein
VQGMKKCSYRILAKLLIRSFFEEHILVTTDKAYKIIGFSSQLHYVSYFMRLRVIPQHVLPV